MAKKNKKGGLGLLVGERGVSYVIKTKPGVTMQLRKYNKKTRQHELFKERKMK